MIMFESSLAIKDSGLLEAYQQLFANAPKFVRRALNDVIEDDSEKVLALLRTEPGPVKRPIKWTSEKQRRAYFATNGFGHGIPYVRTHQLSRSWRMELAFTTGEIVQIRVHNDSPALPFVEGEFQQRFHEITGWLNIDNTFATITRMLESDVETRLIQLFDEVQV